MIEFQTYKCYVCGEQFSVACESQLQENLRKHICHPVRQNKKREHAQQIAQERIALYVHDTVVNRLEEHNFDKLVQQGVFVHG